MHQMQTQQSQLGDLPRKKRLTQGYKGAHQVSRRAVSFKRKQVSLGAGSKVFSGSSHLCDEVDDNRDIAQNEQTEAEPNGKQVSFEDGGAKKADEPFKGREFLGSHWIASW